MMWWLVARALAFGPEEASADLEAVIANVEATHPLYPEALQGRWRAAVARARYDVVDVDSVSEQWFVLARLLGSLGDGHTMVVSFGDDAGFTWDYDLVVRPFGGKLVVTGGSALPLGAEVVSIEGRSFDEMVRLLGPFTSSETASARAENVAYLLPDGLLLAEGRSLDEAIEVVVREERQERAVQLMPVDRPERTKGQLAVRCVPPWESVLPELPRGGDVPCVVEQVGEGVPLRVGDGILAVEGDATAARRQSWGEAGTTVEMQVVSVDGEERTESVALLERASLPPYYAVWHEDAVVVRLVECHSSSGWAALLDETFATAASRDVEVLIVDVRGNTGGGDRNAMLLFDRLVDSYVAGGDIVMRRNEASVAWLRSAVPGVLRWLFPPWKELKNAPDGTIVRIDNVAARTGRPVFDGALYVLQDANTFSSAVTLAAITQHSARGLLVGDVAGGSATGWGNVQSYEAPLSGLRYQLPPTFLLGPNNSEAVVPLEPDIPCDPREALACALADARGEE